jgi:hypothetical protein
MINEQVKRNLSRFPDDFIFQLNTKEFKDLKSHFATSSWGGRRKIPFAFTEHGVLMLSSVLNSEGFHINPAVSAFHRLSSGGGAVMMISSFLTG